MSKDLELKCALCNESKRFVDAKDVKFRHWNIIGWNVATVQPIISCENCGTPKRKEEKTKKVVKSKNVAKKKVAKKPAKKAVKKVIKKKVPKKRK